MGYWDPLELATYSFWDNSNEETIGWLRHAEIKHGRIAMMGFLGYCTTANGIHFPGLISTSGTTYADIAAAGSPPEQWDALPYNGKLQIILAVGFLEWWSELRLIPGEKHYMKGGKPGYFPPFDATPDQLPHWIGFNLYDPFKWSENMSAEEKSRRLLVEVNNGRLAMIGLMGFLSEAKIPGSVPLLKGVIPAYAGDVMAPLAVTTDWSL